MSLCTEPMWWKHLDDDGKLRRRYSNKCVNARAEGIECELTFEEFCILVEKAGLVSSQLGFTGDGYVLARYNDSGNYTVDNCRFVTQQENMSERKFSDKCRQHSITQARKLNEYRKEHPGVWADSVRNSAYHLKLAEEGRARRLLKRSKLDKRYCGEHNSQSGTFWITDGVCNKKWRTTKGPIPEGFYRGRTC